MRWKSSTGTPATCGRNRSRDEPCGADRQRAGRTLPFALVLAALVGLHGCDDPIPNALLWRVERAGLATSYLFGTLHVVTPDIADPSPAVRDALLQADLFAAETQLEMLRAAVSAEVMMAPPEERADRLLDAELLERVVNLAPCYGISPDDLRDAPLWYVVSLLTSVGPGRDPSLQGARTLDEELAEIAKMAGMPVIGLETVPRHLALFMAMSRQDQIGMLREVAKRAECPSERVGPWLDLYREADLAEIRRLQEDQLETMDDPGLWRRYFQRFGPDRNPRMADRMELFMKQGSAFFAVGASHLAGEDGLITLLRGRGWSVEPVE